jgi:hypothetical protein
MSVSALATPLIAIFIGFPLLVVILLFIINSGAYITPPPYSALNNLECGPYENLPFPDDSINATAARAYNIVGGGENVGLYRGFWCNWNKSPQYPDLFDEAIYAKDPYPCVGVYSDSGCTGSYNNGIWGLFWCTQLIIKSYNETSIKIPNDKVNANKMKEWFEGQTNGFIHIENVIRIINNGGNVSNIINQGDTALVHTAYSNEPKEARHASIIWYADNYMITTIDSNGWLKTYNYALDDLKTGYYFGSGKENYIIGIGKRIIN